MKKIILITLTLFTFGCNSNKEKQQPNFSNPEKVIPISIGHEEIEKKSDIINYQIAIDFINSYIKNTIEVKSSPLVTENFKKELEIIINNAWKESPEIGLGFDPIIDGQDSPDEGFELLNFNSKTGYLIVKGIKWESFKVIMKVVN